MTTNRLCLLAAAWIVATAIDAVEFSCDGLLVDS